MGKTLNNFGTNYFNNESISFIRILFILLIIIGVLGLKRSEA